MFFFSVVFVIIEIRIKFFPHFYSRAISIQKRNFDVEILALRKRPDAVESTTDRSVFLGMILI